MVSLREAVAGHTRQFACSALSAGAQANSWLATATGGGGPVVPAASALNGAVASALSCVPDFGGGTSGGGGAGASYDDGPALPGGQCPGDRYNFKGVTEQVNPDNGQTISGTFSLGGSITNRLIGPVSLSRLDNSQGVDTYRFTGSDGNTQDANAAPGFEFTSFQVTEVTNLEGNPDNCGAIEPDPNPSGSGNVDYDDEDGNPQSEPFDIVGDSPFRLPNGDLILPFEFCLASICFDVNFNLSTDSISFAFGGSAGAEVCCPPLEETEDEQSENEDNPPDPDDDRRFVGVVVTFVNPPSGYSATELLSGSAPSLFVPYLATLRFAIEIGGRFCWSLDLPIKQNRVFLPVPPDSTGYAWSIINNCNLQVDVDPVYIASE